MFLVGFIGMLLCVGVHTQQVEGQFLQPICSNSQGVYVIEEGRSVEVCFTLFNNNNDDPLRVNLVTESKSTLGSIATSNIDYVSKNVSAAVSFRNDIFELCQTANISNDSVAERTEYFNVALQSRFGNELASCQVAIIDRNGGPPDCYEEEIANVSLGQIINDRAFCFTNEIQNGPCQRELDPNAVTVDCTRWNPTIFNRNIATEEVFISPTIATADSECVQNIISGMESLYRIETNDPTPTPPRQECATNCVLTIRNNKNCNTSVMLLEGVFREEAMELLGDLEGIQTQLCTVGLQCCDMSQPLPPICRDSQPEMVVVTGIVVNEGQVGETVIIGAVLGGVFGIVIVGGAVVAVVLVVACLMVYLSRRKQKVPFVDSANSRAVVYKRQPADVESTGSVGDLVATPLFNPNYTNENPPDYEIVVSTDLGNASTYPRWRRLFAGMIISPTDLQYGNMIGEGAFGKVFRGTLKTSLPGQGSNGTAQRDVAVKTLKKASKPEEIEDFIAESAIMLDFNHPNVLRLVGVCFDTEDKLPLIVLPYMANGDLRSYLKSKRSKSSSTSDETMPESLSEAVLLGMCMDIAFGMAYLAKCKFVHRDLAARNCMVDGKLSIKVADFGLSRDVYHSDYYRLTHKQRLPVRWMPPESIFDSLYNEKSDVWSYGAVCWEVFKLGRKPYPGLDNAEIPDYISEGNRLCKPHLCPDKLYGLMTQTWREDPKERPTFDQIVEYLAKMTGVQIRQPSEEHEYHSVEGLMEGEEEEDVGGVNIYMEVESPMYKNFPNRPDIVIPPPVPEEYEVPVKTATSRSISAQLDGDQELVVPTEYEVPVVSSLPRSGGQREITTSLSSSSSKQQQQLEDSIQGHVYHTLEAPTNK